MAAGFFPDLASGKAVVYVWTAGTALALGVLSLFFGTRTKPTSSAGNFSAVEFSLFYTAILLLAYELLSRRPPSPTGTAEHLPLKRAVVLSMVVVYAVVFLQRSWREEKRQRFIYACLVEVRHSAPRWKREARKLDAAKKEKSAAVSTIKHQ